MKLDLDLSREILLYLEDIPTPNTDIVMIDGYSKEIIDYHLNLMNAEGYITLKKQSIHGQSPILFEISLTWKGHNFLDASRNNNLWNLLKEKIKAEGIKITLDIAYEMLVSLIKNQLRLV